MALSSHPQIFASSDTNVWFRAGCWKGSSGLKCGVNLERRKLGLRVVAAKDEQVQVGVASVEGIKV